MRRIHRCALPRQASRYLDKKQHEVNAGTAVSWKQARATKAISTVFETLGQMSGPRRRCMFCEDSRGTTIEHFWPKAHYKSRMFVWANFLLLCQGCQSKKGDRLDLDSEGQPLLIDPTAEDPWDHLFFDSATGMIVPRYDQATDAPDAKGDHTTNPGILPLNIEAVTEGRLRTARNLRRAVNSYLKNIQDIEILRVLISE